MKGLRNFIQTRLTFRFTYSNLLRQCSAPSVFFRTFTAELYENLVKSLWQNVCNNFLWFDEFFLFLLFLVKFTDEDEQMDNWWVRCAKAVQNWWQNNRKLLRRILQQLKNSVKVFSHHPNQMHNKDFLHFLYIFKSLLDEGRKKDMFHTVLVWCQKIK